MAKTKMNKKNRCNHCKKRIKMLVMTCKCKGVFCLKCYNQVKHNCTFDYRKQAKELISQSNPIVKFSKLEKIKYQTK